MWIRPLEPIALHQRRPLQRTSGSAARRSAEATELGETDSESEGAEELELQDEQLRATRRRFAEPGVAVEDTPGRWVRWGC